MPDLSLARGTVADDPLGGTSAPEPSTLALLNFRRTDLNRATAHEKDTTVKKQLFLALTALTLGLLTLAPLAQAQTYNATPDFSIMNGNPNGVWAYGFSTTLGGAMTLFDTTDNSFPFWKHSIVQSLGTPTIGRNDTGAVFAGVPVGSLLLHPGQAEFVVLRFTAPSTANYNLLSQAFAGDGGDTELYLLRNSNAGSPLFFAPTTNIDPMFNTTLALAAGDTVDLVIGNKGNFLFDSTPANFILQNVGSASAPEPGTLVLLTSGGLIWIVRRRRS